MSKGENNDSPQLYSLNIFWNTGSHIYNYTKKQDSIYKNINFLFSVLNQNASIQLNSNVRYIRFQKKTISAYSTGNIIIILIHDNEYFSTLADLIGTEIMKFINERDTFERNTLNNIDKCDFDSALTSALMSVSVNVLSNFIERYKNAVASAVMFREFETKFTYPLNYNPLSIASKLAPLIFSVSDIADSLNDTTREIIVEGKDFVTYFVFFTFYTVVLRVRTEYNRPSFFAKKEEMFKMLGLCFDTLESIT